MNVAVTCIVLLAVTFVAALWVLPRTGRAQSLSVLTGSMSPSIPAGSLVFIRPVDPRKLVVGDVITFRHWSNPEVLVTHRVQGFVFGINPELSFRTKGDANSADDPNLVPAKAVVGKVAYHAPYLGYLSARAQTRTGLASLVVLALLLYLGRGVPQLIKFRNKKTEEEADAPAAAPSASSSVVTGADGDAPERELSLSANGGDTHG